MTRLPQRGDVRVAFDMMDARATAAVGERKAHIHDAGSMKFDPASGRFSGDALDAFRLVYGDLFDFEELLVEGGASLLRHAIATIGVLMERKRWER